MKLLNTSSLEVKKSRFLGFYYEIDTTDEIKEILKATKEENKKARHVVYAYKFSNTGGKSDDKEPSGTAGLPLYNLLELNNLNNRLLIVVRYFGGTKLGAGPLMRAYKETGRKAIQID